MKRCLCCGRRFCVLQARYSPLYARLRLAGLVGVIVGLLLGILVQPLWGLWLLASLPFCRCGKRRRAHGLQIFGDFFFFEAVRFHAQLGELAHLALAGVFRIARQSRRRASIQLRFVLAEPR